ncbi:MAG TPA: hypothetical protein VGO30_19325 [Mycobacterium sp.]|nr:hypothetical protein [Mycobacterium sp.]
MPAPLPHFLVNMPVGVAAVLTTSSGMLNDDQGLVGGGAGRPRVAWSSAFSSLIAFGVGAVVVVLPFLVPAWPR